MPRDLFKRPTIADLLAGVPAAGASGTTDRSPSSGAVPLTPVQCWFFEQRLAEPHHWNQAFLFQAPGDLDLERLQEALAAVAAHHDAFRLRFRKGDRLGAVLRARAGVPGPGAHRPASGAAGGAGGGSRSRGGRALQERLDIENGPLARAAHFDLGKGAPGSPARRPPPPDRGRRVVAHAHRGPRAGLRRPRGRGAGATRGPLSILPELVEQALRACARPARSGDRCPAGSRTSRLPSPSIMWRARTSRPARGRSSCACCRTRREALIRDVPARLPHPDQRRAAHGPRKSPGILDGTRTVPDRPRGPWPRGPLRRSRPVADAWDGSRPSSPSCSRCAASSDDGAAAEVGQGAASRDPRSRPELRRAPLPRPLKPTSRRVSRRIRPPDCSSTTWDSSTPSSGRRRASDSRRSPADPGTPPAAAAPTRSRSSPSSRKARSRSASSTARPATAGRRSSDWPRASGRRSSAWCAIARLAGVRGTTPSDFPLVRLEQADVDRLEVAHPLEDVLPLSPMQRLYHAMEASSGGLGFEAWRLPPAGPPRRRSPPRGLGGRARPPSDPAHRLRVRGSFVSPSRS